MQYSPKKFTGEHVQEIFSEVLEANNTVSKGLVRVLDNIKFEKHVTSISGAIDYQPYQEDIRESQIDALSALSGTGPAFEDSTITPVKMMAFQTFGMDDLRNTRFSKDMAAGAASIGSSEFEKTLLAWAIPRLGKAFERKFWNSITAATKAVIANAATVFPTNSVRIKAWAAAQTASTTDGILARLILDRIDNSVNTTIHVVGTAITAANIAAEYAKVFALIPAEVFATGEASIQAPHGHAQMILSANLAATYRDIFTVAGDDFRYLGIKIDFVPLPANTLIAGRSGASGDLILGTDLLSDTDSLEVGKVNNVGDLLFIKQVCTLDSALVVASQKVLYI